MKTQIVQQNNRKTTIEYFSRLVETSTSTTRKTKIFLDNLIQGSVELFVPSSQDSLSFASKTNVTQVVNTTKTSIVQNIAGKTFLSGVTNLTIELVGAPLFIQQNQPVFNDKYFWIQTNVNGNPSDFTFWFEDGTT